MLATLFIDPGPLVTNFEIGPWIETQGIVGTIVAQIELAQRWLASSEKSAQFTIARGVAAKAAHGDYIQLARQVGLRPGTPRPDHSMDFFERGLLTPVSPGEVLGRWIAPSAGEVGRDVRGRELPFAREKTRSTPIKEGITRTIDHRLLAQRAGNLVFEEGERLEIEAVHLHRGDVNLRSGNLHMVGNLQILGNVERGFSVDASGDIELRGSLLGGTVVGGGNVVISGGVIGGDSGFLAARGHASFGHLQVADIRVGGSVAVLSECINTHLCAHSVAVKKRIVGGVIEVTQLLETENLGSANEIETRVHIGAIVEDPIDRARQSLFTQGIDHRKHVRLHGDSPGRLHRASIKNDDEKLAQKIAWRLKLEKFGRNARVVIRGTLFPGVVVMMDSVRLAVEHQHTHVQIRLVGTHLIVEPIL
jgi:uncharacterized protein (DUF342 family)